MPLACPGRNAPQLTGRRARRGFESWWHQFVARHERTGTEKSFFIEFRVCNPASGDASPRFGQLRADGTRTPPSYGLVRAGCWGSDARQVHGFYGAKDVHLGVGPVTIAMGTCSLSAGRLEGAVAATAEEARAYPELLGDHGRLSWDLQFTPIHAHGIGRAGSDAAKALDLLDTFWHGGGLAAHYSGWIDLDGERYVVDETCGPGYADKNWGREPSSPWFWLASTDITNLDTGEAVQSGAFVASVSRMQLGGLALGRHLTAAFRRGGELLEFNGIGGWGGLRFTTQFHEEGLAGHWRLEASTPTAGLEIEMSCAKAEMLITQHHSPIGGRCHNRLWSGGTGTGTLRLLERRNGQLITVGSFAIGHAGCEYGEAEGRIA